MNSTTGSEYTENTYIQLIFAFAAQSSLSKVRNDNAITYESLFAHAGRAPCPHGTVRQHPCRIHKPVLGTRYSGTVTTVSCLVARLAPIVTVYYVQLHIDDAIFCIIDDVMIVLYGMYGIQIVP